MRFAENATPSVMPKLMVKKPKNLLRLWKWRMYSKPYSVASDHRTDTSMANTQPKRSMRNAMSMEDVRW